MKTNFVRVVAFLFVLGLGFGSACSVDPVRSSSVSNQSLAETRDCAISPCSSENKSIAEKPLKQIICQNPLIVGVAFDQSGSMSWSGTAATTAEDLRPLLEIVVNCGGELGVTFVRSNSAKPIERFRADEPSLMPVAPTQNADEEDYEFSDRIDEYNQNLADHNGLIRENRTELEPQIDEYLKTLAPLLAQKPKGGTDFWTSINRLHVFLGESDASWSAKPQRYLVVVSDADNTVGKTKNAFKADAIVFWVNATAPDKNLKDFPYQRFESFQAAVTEILAREGVK